MGLYSDINDFIKEGGRDEELPDKDVKSEGNIPSGRPDSSSRPTKKGNIPSSDPKPQDADQEGNISPDSDRRPPEPNREGSIQPDDDRRPQDAGQEGGIPVSGRAPDPPQRTGNIEPRQFNEESGQLEDNIEANDDRQPPSPRQEGNINPDPSRRPLQARSDNRDARENAAPQDVDPDKREAEDGVAPQEPSRQNVIRLRDGAGPLEPNLEGNIEPTEESEPPAPSQSGNIRPTENSEPPSPRQKGNIEPTEEPPSTEPTEEADIGVGATGEDISDPESGIQPREENQPAEPQTEGNIDPTENPEEPEPDRDGFIQPTEESEPPSPRREGNIDPNDPEETDGIAGESPNREEPLKFQSKRFSGQINPESEQFTDTEEGTFPGSEDGVGARRPPLRYQSQRFAGQINPESVEFTDQVGGTFPGSQDPVPQWRVPRKFQSKRFEGQIDPRTSQYTDTTGGTFPGAEDGAAEWQTPFRYQPSRFEEQINPETAQFTEGIAGRFPGSEDPAAAGEEPNQHQTRLQGQIDPQSEQFTDTDEGSFPGSEDGVAEWQAPLRYQPPEFVSQIDPQSARFTEGIAGTFPGSEDPTAAGREPNQFQTRFPNQIDAENPDTTDGVGGRFEGSEDPAAAGQEESQFQTRFRGQIDETDSETTNGVGGSFPGSEDAQTAGEEPNQFQSRYQGQIDPENAETTDGTAGSFQNQTPEWQPPLKYQPQRFAGQIDPESAEFTDQIGGEFPTPGEEPPAWQAPLKYQSQQFADQINPESAQFTDGVAGSFSGSDVPEWQRTKENQTRFEGQIDPENEGTTDGVGGDFPRSNETPEWQEENENQTRPEFRNQINPNNPGTTDGVGGDFPDSNQTAEWLEPKTSQTRFPGQLEELNEPVRLAEFQNFGDTGNNRPDSPVPRSGFLSLPDFGSEEPFILRRPEAGGGSSFIANVKQADSRTTPIASAAEDTVRLSKFFASGKGITYNIKQQFLQSQNPRTRTRIYDPTSPLQASASGLPARPGQDITRHLSADSGPGELVGQAATEIGDELGFQVPSSSRYIDELNEEAVETEYGEMRGSLFWLNPVTTADLPEEGGKAAQRTIERRRSEQVQNITEVFSTSELEKLDQFVAGSLASRGGVGDGYLFTRTYDPMGGPDSEGTEETDNYHPALPYVENVDFVNSRFNPDALSYVEPQFSPEYVELRQKVEDDRDDQESFFPYENPGRTPDTRDIRDGDGNVVFNRQNDTTDEAYFENRAYGDGPADIPLHRGVPDQEESRAFPNYSKENSDGKKIKRIDFINRLEPIIGENVDPDQEQFGDGQHSDLIPFKFYDIENSALIVFRAFLEGISDNLSPEWNAKDYSGRPEQAYVYGGYTNTLSFSFQVVPFSEEEFEACWKKINYMKGLTTPANYSFARGGGSYMVPPQMRLTIGDMFNHVHGHINSLTISVNDDMPWELDPTVGRLPQGIEIDVDWQVVENRDRPPKAGQKFYDAPFIEETEEAVTASPEPQPEVQPSSADETLEQEPTGTLRAVEQAEQSP